MAIEFDQDRIEAAIVSEVSQKLVSDDDLWQRAKTAFEARVDNLWHDTVAKRIEAAVDGAVAAGFDREYQKVDSYGRKVGQPTSISAELEKLITSYWGQPVGRDGKAVTSSYGDKTTRAEWLMAKMCADDFSGQMKQHVINVGGALKDAFRKELHATVARLLSDVFNVRSADDQGKGREVIDPVAKPIGPA